MWPIENQARSLKSVRKLRGSNTQSSEPNLGNLFWRNPVERGATDVTFSVDVRENFFCLIPSPYEKVMAVLLNPCRVRVFFFKQLLQKLTSLRYCKQ
jgi:hypothetical protein